MTAVEWLIEKIENHPNSWENSSVRRMNISIDTSEYLDLKREALAMEREQMVTGWVRLPKEPNIGDKVIVCIESHGRYAEGIYEGKNSILTAPNCHCGSWDKWLLIQPVR